MLASRGAVYYSKQEAVTAGQGRWSVSGRVGEKYHDNCKCQAVEVSETSGLSEANILLHDLWQKTFWGKDYSTDPRRQIDTVDFGSAFPIWKEVLADTDLPWMSGKQLTR